ncbi:TIGR03960 family B12-binding radical SAM protein [Brucepastera parasyntrophica]|uniref:TIGR03960 family B12-binding radical SAM protein n=1 Tax=Brucepastera parasyntrophica TaxID=2880008 RepID=UPI0021098E50|nr:TIGR03960 family B12-binding radical SAM protein [Brucepastera parasyntrophica]ULQ59992.1 TIGR03960 family B12-binding radical SAM protein [Brucepastera parasyntrophica]
MTRHIDPLKELARDLIYIQNPVQYLGGEYGQIIKQSAELTFAIAFPDLYEIGMSNLAIKILYDRLNRLPSVRCERVFAPARDFEDLLKQKQLPLYTLESGIPLNEVDILGISMGYEPGITGLLAILDTGNIPLKCSERNDNDPIIFAGGCGITNPAPFSDFIDAFFIGEAEAGMFELIQSAAEIKSGGASRQDILNLLESHPSVWTAGKDERRKKNEPCARRAIYTGFGSVSDNPICFPVPNMRVVQDHGSIEIMRGCPNGCRFCHAGVFYRPQRMKPAEKIISDADFLINRGGYREISLLSLSSGDYENIETLCDILTSQFRHKNVSFQLPSLKVNSFTLPLLEKISQVRRGGLTFAVETPVDAWQLSLNKEVYRDKIIRIILEAKKSGWSKAKFYFMAGLPVPDEGILEEEEIVSFLLEIQDITRIQCNVNIGTFIPKPHTPFQWSKQLSISDAEEKYAYVRANLPKGRFKLNTHRPFNSFLEGVLTRNDKKTGKLILEAYNRGCRLDAWEDKSNSEIWMDVFNKAEWDVEKETLRDRQTDEPLPWDGVSLGVSKAFLKREKERSEKKQLTPQCSVECKEPCGVCNSSKGISLLTDTGLQNSAALKPSAENANVIKMSEKGSPEAAYRVIIEFAKKGEAAYIPHLSLVEIWNKAFQRSGLPVIFTEGFNPLPRFEIAQSMSLGISSEAEIASFLLYDFVDESEISLVLNESLPDSIRIGRVFAYRLSRKIKRKALSTYLWGNRYIWTFYNKNIKELLLNNDRIQEYLKHHTEIIFTDEGEDRLAVTLPFEHDRETRDMVSEILSCNIQESIHIHKISSIAQNDTEKTSDFFEAFQTTAEKNNKALLLDSERK